MGILIKSKTKTTDESEMHKKVKEFSTATKIITG